VEVWSADLPFTFQWAVINDRGVSAGYGFTGGLPEYEPNGEFIAAIVSPGGEVVFEERIELEVGDQRFVHDPPEPSVRGILLQPDLDHLVLRLDDDSWWSYDLLEGALRSKARVAEGIEGIEEGAWSLAAHAVPGTPLIISQWYARDDARFVLLDPDFQSVWSLVLSGDYAEVDGEDPFYEVRDAGGAILDR